jgi:alpha-galactosidase/6-phospho-beta-glucosidase family protein
MACIAEAIGKCAPDAWLINFTNPSGVITEYLLNHTPSSDRALQPADRIAGAHCKAIGVPMEQVRLETVSLNHCGAITAVYVGGENVLPSLLEPEALDRAAAKDEWVQNYRRSSRSSARFQRLSAIFLLPRT